MPVTRAQLEAAITERRARTRETYADARRAVVEALDLADRVMLGETVTSGCGPARHAAGGIVPPQARRGR